MRAKIMVGVCVAWLAGCGPDAQLDRTLATVELVRGEATIGEAGIERVARAAPSQTMTIAERGLARLTLDSGARLLLDSGAELTIADEETVALSAGRAYAESGEGEELFITAGDRTLRAADAALSATAEGDGLSVYVVRGEVSWTSGDARGVARAGERVRLAGEPTTEPVTLWRDWTGGLARPGPDDARGASGVGVLEARVPDEVGQARWPLVIRRLDVRVSIVGDLAVTEVEQVFFNPASEMVEGLYRVRVPESAVLQRFAVDRSGTMVDGYVREQAQARQAYEAQVYRGSQLDPALLEWVAPGRYKARIYPIRPGETRRIVIRYAEWLAPIAEGGSRLYRYPMGAGRDAPRIQELSIAVDVEEAGVERLRAGMGAAVEEGRVRLRRSDFAPRSDFWLELVGDTPGQRAWQAPHEPPPRAPDARTVVGEADERAYWYLPLRLPERLFEDARAEGVDLVIVTDVSAGTDRAQLELGRSVTEALTAHLDENDRVAIVTSDLTIRSLVEGAATLGAPSTERVEGLLDALARVPAGGATDLGAALGAAAGLLSPDRPGAVIYVGDGAPTVGELEADGLLERIARLPEPLRLYAIGVGGDADLDLLEVLTRGGGLALRVEERAAAADAALRVLGHVTRPVAQRVTVDVGAGIENVYPRRPVDVVEGETLSVVGRIREQPPAEVTVRGTIAGEAFEETIAIRSGTTEQSTDLRLRWAGERLRQLLLDGAGREEVAELGVRYGLITPFSSYYVPSAAELSGMGPMGSRWIDRRNLLQEVDRTRRAEASGWTSIFAVGLGPLLLTGCGDEDEAMTASGAVAPVTEEPMMPGAAMDGPAQQAAQEQRARMEAQRAMAQVAEAEAAEEVAMPEAEPSPDMAPPTTTAAPAAPPADTASDLRDPWGGSRGGGARAGDAQVFGAAQPGRAASDAVFGGEAGGGGDGAPARQALPRPSRARRTGRRGGLASTGASIEDLLDSALGGGGYDDDAEDRRGAPTENERSNDGDFWGDDETNTRGARVAANDASRIVVTTTEHGRRHQRRRCSDASRQSLSDREELWRERLGAAGGPSGYLGVYRQAIRECEAPTWRDRRALLGLIVGAAGSVPRMLSVYQMFTSGSARGFLRGAILRRVRSPQDLRAVRGAFGLGREPDWELVEQVLERARGEEGRLRALRRLVMQYSDSFDLKLRLLEALETAGHEPEARRLADRLRADPASDMGVRTAIGEMFLRMGREEEARRVFSEIVEFAPLDELARRRLGDLYRAHGWFEDAYRQYQTLATIRPDDPSALLLLAQAAAGAGRVDEALRLEQRLMETAQPGAAQGIARVAQLWTSVRLAKLRRAAREADDAERLDALERRIRRSGVLTAAGDLRVTLVWSHPDAQLGLWAAHPGGSLARPLEIAPEHGIEAFDVPEQEDGAYRFEVRRADPESPTDMQAQLVLVWHEGQDDEVIRVVDLDFSGGRDGYEWTLDGSALTEG